MLGQNEPEKGIGGGGDGGSGGVAFCTKFIYKESGIAGHEKLELRREMCEYNKMSSYSEAII
jgi:hypothetical protein